MPLSFFRRLFPCVAFGFLFLCCPWGGSAFAAKDALPPVALPEERPLSLLPAAGTDDLRLTAEERLDLHCLSAVYPSIDQIVVRSDGAVLLRMKNGMHVPYLSIPPAADDVKAAMAQPYPAEPLRPPTPAGTAPGRVRSSALLAALYGDSQRRIRSQLVSVPFLRGAVSMHQAAADAFRRVTVRLQAALREKPSLLPWLKSDGGFAWRRIAGETRLSAHAYGIAVDLSAHRAPYWRWSKIRPHPLQQTYPEAIVRAFEEEGFIWGGKWHEYDIMHFEYRPELLCKARGGNVRRLREETTLRQGQNAL